MWMDVVHIVRDACVGVRHSLCLSQMFGYN
jgi:hypothetical protein